MTTTKNLKNPTPGEILKHEFLKELKMSQNVLAKSIGVPPNRIHAIVRGMRHITADTDLRLCKFFSLSDGYFLRLQNTHELLEAKRKFRKQITAIHPLKRVEHAMAA